MKWRCVMLGIAFVLGGLTTFYYSLNYPMGRYDVLLIYLACGLLMFGNVFLDGTLRSRSYLVVQCVAMVAALALTVVRAVSTL